MQMASSSSRSPHQLFALCSAVVTFLLLTACGDDGTDGLSWCPEYRIQADKAGVQHCAPRAGSGGSGGAPTTTPRAGAGAGGGSSQQRQPSAGKPAAGSGGAAANSGMAGVPANAPPIPKGVIWTCVQVSTTCSCAMTDTAVDSCMKPLPGCCMLVRSGEKYSGCVCYAENSVECGDRKKDPMNFVPVSTCPPT